MILAVLVLSFYFIYQGIILFSSPVKTERLKKFTAYDSYNVSGLAFRTETLIRSTVSGNPEYSFSDGEKVRKGTVVATIYSEQGKVADRTAIKDIEKKIALLQSSKELTDLYKSDAASLESSIDTIITKMNTMRDSGDTAGYSDLVDELQNQFTKKQLVLGQITDIDSQIAELESKRDSMQTGSNTKNGTVSAEMSGYFSSAYDGYENLINPAKMLEGGYAAYKEITELKSGSAKPENYVGKVVDEFSWYFSAVLPLDTFKKYNLGDSLSLRILSAGSENIPATVAYTQAIDDSSIYMIFSCEYYNNNLVNLRFEKVDVITNTYNGYKVDRQAVRMVNNQTGVYVQAGSQIQFKPVKVLFSKEDYMIIQSSDTDSSLALLPNEYIVVKGKNLFDGKIIS